MAFINPEIVIVGGGISGVAAAENLLKAGFRHVRILEATQRSGGRIKTSTLGKCLLYVILWHLADISPPDISGIYVYISASKFMNVNSSGLC